MEELIELIHSEDAAVRRDAAYRLAGADARAIYPLVRALWDENPGVQEAAMSSLMSFAGEEAIWAVMPLLREDAPRRNMALQILARIGGPHTSLIARDLNDKDADIRKFVIDIFGDVGSPEVVPHLIHALSDENANVRAAAARSLGILHAEEAVPRLVGLLDDEEWVAFVAIEALGKIADEKAVGALISLLQSPSDTLRTMAIESLGEIRSPLASAALFETIERVDHEEKKLVAKSLVNIGVRSTRELSSVLMDLLREDSYEDKEAAIAGLISLRYKKAVPLLIEQAGALDVSIPEDEELYRKLMDAVVEIGDTLGLVKLLANKGMKYRARVAVIDALGRLKSHEAVKPLMGFLTSDAREVRRAAASAEATIGVDMSGDDLMDGLHDQDGHVRRSVSRALGAIGDRKAVPALLELVKKENYPDVLEDAVSAVAELDPEALVELAKSKRPGVRLAVARTARGAELIHLIKDSDPKVRIAAVLSLGTSGTEDASATLSKLTKSTDPEVRKAAVRGLGFIGDDAARKALARCVSDKDMWVRMFAVDALSDIGEASAASGVRKLLAQSEEGPVRIAALRYLARYGNRSDIGACLDDADPLVREEAERALEIMAAGE